MHEDTVVSFSHPDRISITDPLTEVLRAGARRLLAEAELQRRDQNVRKFGYHDGGLHAYNPQVSANLVNVGVASFLNYLVIAVETFMKACQTDRLATLGGSTFSDRVPDDAVSAGRACTAT